MDQEQAARGAEWRAWAGRQLDGAGWTRDDETHVRYIVDQFLGLAVVGLQTDASQFGKALDLVDELLRDRALTAEHWTAAKRARDAAEASLAWRPVQPGQPLNRRDRVRVAPSAYTGDMASHNGLTGTIMDVRHGLGIVHYDGTDPGTGFHHQIRFLETPAQA